MKIKTIQSIKELVYYILAVIALYFCSNISIGQSGLGLSMGLYIALIYCRSNMLFLAPCYIAINLICNSSLEGIFYAITPVIVMTIARYCHFRTKRPMRVLSANMYCLISLIPLIFCDMYRLNWGVFGISLVLNQIFCSFCITICYALLVRGIYQKMSIDEIASGIIVIAIISYGAYNINLFDFRPFFLLLGGAIIYGIYYMDIDKALLISIAVATGASLAMQSLAVVGGVVFTFLIGYTFNKLNIWLAGAGCILANALCGIYFDCFAGYNIIHTATFSVGIILFCLVPKVYKNKLPMFKSNSKSQSATLLCNNIRKDISHKITNVSHAFYQMADAFCTQTQRQSLSNPSYTLSLELVSKVCSKCPNYTACNNALGKPYYMLFENVFGNTLAKKTLIDLPNFVNTRCSYIPELLSQTNLIIAGYNSKLSTQKKLASEQILLANQFAGIANILGNLSEDINQTNIIDTKVYDRIIQELGYQNIVCSEVTVGVKGTEYEVSLIVRKDDEFKKSLPQVISRVLGTPLVCAYEKTVRLGNKVNITLRNKPCFDLAFATNSISKMPNTPNGDTLQLQRIGYNKAVVALCDGMGNGKFAKEHSSQTLELISKLYSSDLDRNNSISMVNRLLAFTANDNFSALDMCIVDLNNGMCDFIKMGGVESYIKRESSIEIINPQALPIGIIEDAYPQVQQRNLDIGDIVTICSDGITDCLTSNGIKSILEKIGTINPQQICDEILAQAKIRGLNDDASIISFRIFQN